LAKLFEGIRGDKTNADIGWMSSKSPFYNSGYLLAAEELVKGFDERPTNEKDSLVFPIVFLYRQHIELTLKDIIGTIDRKLSETEKRKALERHKLLNLWDLAITQYETFISNRNISLVFTEKIKKERDIVKQFNQTDEDSFSFRFATDKKGKNLLEGIDYISIKNFREQIALVLSYLDKMNETISHEST